MHLRLYVIGLIVSAFVSQAFAAPNVEGFEVISGWLNLHGNNTTLIDGFWHNCDCPNGVLSAIQDGSTLLVGMVEGSDTIVYSSYGVTPSYPYPAVGPVTTGSRPDGYHYSSFPVSSHNDKIQGTMSIIYDNANEFSNEYLLGEVTLGNAADTSLQVLSGMLFDFDISTLPVNNYAGFDAGHQLVWTSDWVDSEVTGVMFLSGKAHNLRTIRNSNIYNGNTIDPRVAYREMLNPDNQGAPMLHDWYNLLTFAVDTLTPHETVTYQFALLYSRQGFAHLLEIAETVRPSANYGAIGTSPFRLRTYQGTTAVTNPPDTQFVVNYYGPGAIPWQLNHSASWAQLDKTFGITGDTVHVTYSAVGMSAGKYWDTLWIHSDLAVPTDRFAILELTVIPGSGAIHVPADYPTIQAAIDASVNGDRILVAPGSYRENLDFQGKEIKLIGEQGALQTKLSRPNTYYNQILLNKGEGSWTEISGFTISSAGNGNVVENSFSSPIIANNIFSGDSLGGSSQILASTQSNLTIVGNLFYNCSANNAVISCFHNGASLIQNNTFDRCRYGMDIYSSTVIAKNNIVTNGTIGFLVGGDTSEIVLTNNNSWNNLRNYRLYVIPHDPIDFDFGPTNISADPHYCHAEKQDYHLTQNSPCAPAHSPGGVLMGAYAVNCTFACGDADGSGYPDISDAVYLIVYIFGGGPRPSPIDAGDVDCSGSPDISDIVYLISFIFGGGPAPCSGC